MFDQQQQRILTSNIYSLAQRSLQSPEQTGRRDSKKRKRWEEHRTPPLRRNLLERKAFCSLKNSRRKIKLNLTPTDQREWGGLRNNDFSKRRKCILNTMKCRTFDAQLLLNGVYNASIVLFLSRSPRVVQAKKKNGFFIMAACFRVSETPLRLETSPAFLKKVWKINEIFINLITTSKSKK